MRRITPAEFFTNVRAFGDRMMLQIRIVLALSDMEFALRAEKGALGVWGVVFEPLALIAVLLVLKIVVKLKTVDIMNPVIWMTCGVALLYLFKKVAIKSLGGVSKKQRLFFYRRIRPLDTLLASTLIESRIQASVLVTIFLAVSFWTWTFQIDDPALMVVDLLLTVCLGLGVGISALVIGHRIPFVKTLTKFGINRILLWTSGIFYATYTLPGPARPFVTWNPLLHSVELLRHSINSAYPLPDISLQYLGACALISLGFGLLFYFSNEALLLSDD